MTMRTYALMKPDGVLEIAFQAEGISDAWIFAQDFMQRTAEELGQEGFHIMEVQIWPDTFSASIRQADFWHTMESAPRDRDILLYIGERPADTPWVQGRYIAVSLVHPPAVAGTGLQQWALSFTPPDGQNPHYRVSTWKTCIGW